RAGTEAELEQQRDALDDVGIVIDDENGEHVASTADNAGPARTFPRRGMERIGERAVARAGGHACRFEGAVEIS
ncbi:MAG TPA: hypothetical protein VHB97_08415, partial [Polyangia bacterium]|nr:hypothetical protein [Polyangia bacterium]